MAALTGRMLTRARDRVFYGWWMVSAGFGLMFFTTGVGFYGFAAFVDPLVAHFGWPRALIGAASSLRSAESGLLGPVVGYLSDRLGPRVILITAFVVEGIGFILLSQVHNLWQFFAAFSILALGLGGGSFLVVSTAINNWFVRRRGRALSFMFLGPAFSGFLVGGLVWLVEALGWRGALIVAGVSMWVFCIPLSLVMKRRPETYGLRPDGDRPGEQAGTPGRGRTGTPPRDVQLRIGSVLRSRSYWQYTVALALQGAGFGALVLFQLSALKSFGVPVAQAALVVVLWTLSSIPGRLASGFLSDAFDKRLVFAGSMVLQLVGVAFFLMTTNFWLALGYAAFHGMGWGATTPSRLALQSEYWGRNIFGFLMGLQQSFSAAFGIVAPIFVGRWFDVYEDYHGAFLVLFAPLFLCIILILTMKPPEPEDTSTSTGALRGAQA